MESIGNVLAGLGLPIQPSPAPDAGPESAPGCEPWCHGRGVRRHGPGLVTPSGAESPTLYALMAAIPYEYCPCAAGRAAADRHEASLAEIAAKESQRAVVRIWDAAELPTKLREYTVDTYLGLPGAQRSLVEKLRRWQCSARDRGTWLVLSGAQGTCKTGLAVALLQEDLAARRSGLYVAAPDFLERIRQTYGAGRDRDDAAVDAREVMASAVAVDTLLLDDVGKETLSDWGRERMFMLVNDRDAWKRRTIVTTNLALAELEAHLGEATFDRIRGNATDPDTGESFFVRLTGPSRRGQVLGAAEPSDPTS